MTKNPAQPDDTPEPEGGRAAERLRDLMMGRFETAAESGQAEPGGNAPPDDTGPGPEPEPTKD